MKFMDKVVTPAGVGLVVGQGEEGTRGVGAPPRATLLGKPSASRARHTSNMHSRLAAFFVRFALDSVAQGRHGGGRRAGAGVEARWCACEPLDRGRSAVADRGAPLMGAAERPAVESAARRLAVAPPLHSLALAAPLPAAHAPHS